MAVKVMVASTVARADAARPAPRREGAAAEPRPRRRRSSVYDADGNEVFITLMCLKCHKMRPLSQFGLRKMADGAIRNQPWCRPCRSTAGTRPSRGSAETGDSSLPAVPGGPVLEGASPAAGAPSPAAASAAPAASPGPSSEPRSQQQNLAAQVAAALAAGLGR